MFSIKVRWEFEENSTCTPLVQVHLHIHIFKVTRYLLEYWLMSISLALYNLPLIK